jgi:uncharacterized protein
LPGREKRMRLPFLVGKPATGEYFIDRKGELEKLETLVMGVEDESASNVALIGMRRTGKTSIIVNLVERLRGDGKMVPVGINCYGISSKSRFSKVLRDAAIDAYVVKTNDTTYGTRILKILKDTGRSLAQTVSEISLSELDIKLRDIKADEDQLIVDAMEYIGKLAEEKGVFFLVIFDEFQDVIAWGDPTLKRIRTVIQSQKRVCYLLAGSATTVMHNLVNERRSPFYRQFLEIPIGKIEKKEVMNFLTRRFNIAGLNFDDQKLSTISAYCDGFPDYVQRLGMSMYLLAKEKGKDTLTSQQIEECYENMLDGLEGEFENYFASLARLEREILIAIASGKETTAEIARDTRKKIFNLPKTLTRLSNYGIVARIEKGTYKITDPVLLDWISRRYVRIKQAGS